jgi:hypothetical protein
MLIVVVLLVYSIFEPKNLFMTLMLRHVNPMFLPIENNIARAHFLVEVKKHVINQVHQLLPYITKGVVIVVVEVEASETCQSSFDQELGA